MNALPLLYPPRLSRGDTLGLVAPASPPDQPEKIDEAIERLIAQGFRIKPGRFVEERNGYLAGTDQARADDVQAMFADPEVHGIVALRGGYGSCRILPLLDYDQIRAHPKSFIGYSDITALHQAILVKAGLVTFHGPNAREAFLPGNAAAFHEMFLEPFARESLTLFSGERHAELKTVVPGRVTGRLLGGNMTCLLRLLGTPFVPDFRQAILFLEDIGERAYRIDGMFTHLRLAGVLGQLGGLVLGHFDHADPAEWERIAACLQREAEQVGIPCVSGAPIGHFPDQIIVPMGLDATLDAGERTLNVQFPPT